MLRNAGHLLENYFNKFFMGKGKKKSYFLKIETLTSSNFLYHCS